MFLWSGVDFLWLGAGHTAWAGRPASQPDRSAWAGRLPGRPAGRPAGRRPDSGPNRPANAGPPAGGRPAASKQPGEPPRRRTCAPGSPPPLHLSTFVHKQRAKFRFLGTANRARKVAFAYNREKRCAHLLQNCSTTLPLVQKTPNGAPVAGNELLRGAKILGFSSKSRV